MWYNVFFTVQSEKPLKNFLDLVELLTQKEENIIFDTLGIFPVAPSEEDT